MNREQGKWMTKWGDTEIEWEEAKRRADEAEELSKGFNLITTEERQWYEDSYTEHVVNYFQLARLIEKVRRENDDKANGTTLPRTS